MTQERRLERSKSNARKEIRLSRDRTAGFGYVVVPLRCGSGRGAVTASGAKEALCCVARDVGLAVGRDKRATLGDFLGGDGVVGGLPAQGQDATDAGAEGLL